MVVGIGDIEVPGGVHRYASRGAELGAGGRAAVTRVANQSIARHCGDDSCGGHLPNAVVAVISDIEVPAGVDGYAGGKIELRAAGRATVARVTRRTIACHRGDDSLGGHLPDAVVD